MIARSTTAAPEVNGAAVALDQSPPVQSLVARSADGSATRASPPSVHLDDVLLRLPRIFLQIADRSSIRWFALRESRDQAHHLVLEHRQVHIEDAMVRRRIYGHLAARPVDADAGFKCFNHLFPIQRPGLFDARRPQ